MEPEMEKVVDGHSHSSSSSSSSSDSETKLDSKQPLAAEESSPQPKVFRLFGRERPVHDILGGGKPADVFLWRDKKISAVVLGTATIVWILFELVEYHLLTLICHILILSLALLFMWSNVHTFINKTPPNVPEICLPEEPFLMVASQFTGEINRAFVLLRDIASGKELKKFLMVIAAFWVVSVVGNWCNFLTLTYILFVTLHTVPIVYEKYDHKIDPIAEKATIEMKKHYSVFDEKIGSKIPSSLLRMKKA